MSILITDCNGLRGSGGGGGGGVGGGGESKGLAPQDSDPTEIKVLKPDSHTSASHHPPQCYRSLHRNPADTRFHGQGTWIHK